MTLHDQIKWIESNPYLTDNDGSRAYEAGFQDARHAAAQLALASDARIAELEAVLTKAVVQNSHDMLLTGEELRECEKILKGQP